MRTASAQPLPQRIAGTLAPHVLATAPPEVIAAVLTALRSWTPRGSEPGLAAGPRG